MVNSVDSKSFFRASHAATRAMAQREILLRCPTLIMDIVHQNVICPIKSESDFLTFSPRNVSELETVQRAIHHIPELLDAAMAAMMEPNIQPPEVEVINIGDVGIL